MMLDAVDLVLLRARYVVALDRYRVHGAKLVQQIESGRRLPVHNLRDEQQALCELATVRRELLDALAATQPEVESEKENA